MKSGVVDSLGIVKLLAFIEQKFRVELQDEDFVPENFETINSMLNLIEKRTVNA